MNKKSIGDMKRITKGLNNLSKYQVDGIDFYDGEIKVSISKMNSVGTFDVSELESLGWVIGGTFDSFWSYLLNQPLE